MCTFLLKLKHIWSCSIISCRCCPFNNLFETAKKIDLFIKIDFNRGCERNKFAKMTPCNSTWFLNVDKIPVMGMKYWHNTVVRKNIHTHGRHINALNIQSDAPLKIVYSLHDLALRDEVLYKLYDKKKTWLSTHNWRIRVKMVYLLSNEDLS